MSSRKAQLKGPSSARRPKPPQDARVGNLAGRSPAKQTTKNGQLVGERLREMRHMVRAMSRQIDELEVVLRAMDVLESKQAMHRWFNDIVPALGARPIDLCRTPQGLQAVLRELGRIEHGVYS